MKRIYILDSESSECHHNHDKIPRRLDTFVNTETSDNCGQKYIPQILCDMEVKSRQQRVMYKEDPMQKSRFTPQTWLQKVTTPVRIQEIPFVDTETSYNCEYQKYDSKAKQSVQKLSWIKPKSSDYWGNYTRKTVLWCSKTPVEPIEPLFNTGAKQNLSTLMYSVAHRIDLNDLDNGYIYYMNMTIIF